MFRNNLIVAIRNIKKRKSFAIINIFGLTVGMTVCFLILTYARFEMSYDRFHPHAEDIYRVTVDLYAEGTFQTADAQCYPAVGPMAVEEFPEVEDFAMARHIGRFLFKNDDKAFNEDRVYFANPSWLTVFDWGITQGDRASALEGVAKIVITESIAKKYFGDEDPMGKVLTAVPGGAEVPMQVTGVVNDVPENAHLKFDILISYQTGVQYLKWDYNSWNGNNEFMYLKTNGAKLDNAFAERFNKSFIAKTEEDRAEKLIIQPLTDIHLKSDRTFEADVNGNQATVNILLLVAMFVLVIAWVNYINLSTAKALERGKEVGVRKVLGSNKAALLNQFLTESFLINLLSLVLTLTLIQGVLPFFNQFSGLSLSFNVFSDPILLSFVLVFLLIGTLVSGAYPALVLANYKPLEVLKGSLGSSKKGIVLRKGLVVFQFMITMVLLAGTMVIYAQVQEMRSQKLGVNIDQTVVVRSPLLADSDETQLLKRQAFKNELQQLPQVSSIAYSETLFGQGTSEMNSATGVYAQGHEEGKSSVFFFYRVDAEFVRAFDFKILSGRTFDDQKDPSASVNFTSIMVNETARRMLGFNSNEEAIGAKVYFWSNEVQILGVFNDYNHHSLKTSVDPTIFWFDKNGGTSNYASVKLNTENSGNSYKEMVTKIESAYRNVYPNSDFDYFFLDEKFNEQYKADQQFGTVFGVFASITVFVSILGLFGLVLYEVQQKIKEIGIRKVLGANVSSIIRMLSTNFMKLIFLSVSIALPIAYFGAEKWLQTFAYQTDLAWYIFVLPALLIIGIAFLTVVLQSIKVARRNPIEALRYE
ncbi:ABC transporter permease [uncultured Roseivirga sp.]|uniref:ABC transporter permease n=1 Tax=uncultured Roseivirga sp. TaxID=543088 RepID=UPI0030DA4596